MRKIYWSMSSVFESGSGNPTPHVPINHDNNPKKKNYTARPPTFSGDNT